MIRLSVFAALAVLAASTIHAANYEPATLTVPAAGILGAEMLQGELYTIAESVTVEGYMNHFTVNTEFGQFAAVGNRALKKLLHEIEAIAELKQMTSLGTGTDAVVGVVADTGKSVANIVIHPVQSAKGISAGVSRFFKRTSRTAKKVGEEVSETISGDDEDGAEKASENDGEPGMTTKLTYSYLGINKAHRALAKELEVDPYSDNTVLQAELTRVAQVSGSVGKITKFLIPIPSVVGIAKKTSDLVWNMSPSDLLILNEEKLQAMGYTEELIQAFFSNKFFTPTQQTAFVAALESLDKSRGREVLMAIAISAESDIEGAFIVRSTLYAQIYHENIEPVTELMSVQDGLVPVAITASGNGMIIAPLDHLLWTEEIAAATEELGKLIDDRGVNGETLMWVEGRVSDMATAQLKAAGWVESTEGFQQVEGILRD